ncbi:carboxypeptidase-like regulatory domain-containing protein [Hymenobacter sp. ASUV-10]|uniref:Carboxypeptidase-like regulatory domain-containing protein n=1 Tax=Hymenobacter aranciens TaxID=3063996 RepID=A0ABT9B5B4_9BACT|nr:carboxypeptidase-like regulatory domain-containing protein [Hymenobacter sp. ASUV-10]MDO7873464.1 carboxypeptidase-like regulatory domain-containing protein [Hymenobacter sp. ASUV-10]
MKHFVLALSLALGSGAAVLTTSCSSSEPEPAKAALSGQITPAGSVSTVTATTAGGQTFTATPSSTGAYSFPSLTVGAYTLSFTAAPGYTAPAPQQVTLAAGGTTAPSTTITLAPASASFVADGTPVTATYIFSQVFSGDRRLTFTVSPGGAPGPTLFIHMDGALPVVGSYSLINGNGDYDASYLAPNYQNYYSDMGVDGSSPGVGGTFTITNVNATARRFSGTFSFTAYGSTNAGTYVPAVITNGVFTNVTY